MIRVRLYPIKHALLFGLLWSICGVAQGQDSTDATTELLKLQATFQNISYTSFNVAYYYEEDNATSMLRDTLTGVYKINKDKYHYILDSVEQVQNDLYHVTVDHDNKTVYVEKPYAAYTSVLQSNIMDSVFIENYVSQMLVSDSSGYRKLTIQFKEGAPYKDYQLLYVISSLQLASVKFTVRKEAPPEEEVAVPRDIRVRIVFSNYQTGAFGDSVFATDWIFTRENGVLVLKADRFSNYELANSYDEQ